MNTTTDVRIDESVLREIMATLAAGVAFVTTVGADERPQGLTTTAVTSVSLDPPLLLVCVARESRTLTAIRTRGGFCVNLLDAGYEALALEFASKAEDKFARIDWDLSPGGLPILEAHSLAWAECTLEQEIEAGDHLILLGHVREGFSEGTGRHPLMYFRREFGSWAAAVRAVEENGGGFASVRTDG